MHIVTLAQGPYSASIVGEREGKRWQREKTFLLSSFLIANHFFTFLLTLFFMHSA
jgi:hypothetical protein